MSKKVAVIIGHRSARKGAFSPFLNESEYDYMKKVAYQLTDVADIYERPNSSWLTRRQKIKSMISKINAKNYDLVISLHFNAFKDKRAHGATALYYITNKRTKQLATKMVTMISSEFAIKKRNLIVIKSLKQRGGQFIISTKADSILLEPFFGTNKEALSFYKRESKYASLIRRFINQL